jgi:hypothetical protein
MSKNELSGYLQHALKNIKWINNQSRVCLNFLLGINRGVNPNHVTTISKSYERLGSLQTIICCEIDFITGKKELYILDGQHKFTALIRLGWEIPYIVIPIKDKRDLVESIALLNSSSKPWGVQDYVNSWASLEPDYVKLNRYNEIYDFELSIVASILSCRQLKTNAGGSSISKAIRAGEFRIVDEEQQISILDDLTDVFRIIPRMTGDNRTQNRYVCVEYVNFRRSVGCNYNHDEFMKNLEANKKQFILATQEQERLSDMFRKLSK